MTDWTDLSKNTTSWKGLVGFLRKEDYGFLLQENDDKIKLESNADASITWTGGTKNTPTWGFQDKS